jgi:parallel beta-helix repeat protein
LNPNAFAGGILHNGTLTLTNVIVSGNSANSSSGAAYGGGIYSSGRLFLINSRVISNAVTTLSGVASGGGIVAGFGLTLTNSTVSGNTARDSGGGIFGGAALINSTLRGNTARNGGGIYGAELLLINSTISGNHAHDNGSGIYHSGSSMNLFNVTITGNMANDDGSGSGFGGGVANASGTVNFQNTIIGSNLNVIIVDGFPILNPEDCSGTLTSGGYNIVSETTDCTINGSFTQANPNLGPLANNGGSTQTHALLPGSPAIDAGNAGGCTDNLGALLATDQRGFHRPVWGETSLRCDIGAYELQQLRYLPLILR